MEGVSSPNNNMGKAIKNRMRNNTFSGTDNPLLLPEYDGVLSRSRKDNSGFTGSFRSGFPPLLHDIS